MNPHSCGKCKKKYFLILENKIKKSPNKPSDRSSCWEHYVIDKFRLFTKLSLTKCQFFDNEHSGRWWQIIYDYNEHLKLLKD